MEKLWRKIANQSNPSYLIGEVPERLNGTDSKSVLRLRTVTGVRIPPSPLEAISKEVKSPQILYLRAFLILLSTQIAPIRSKNQ